MMSDSSGKLQATCQGCHERAGMCSLLQHGVQICNGAMGDLHGESCPVRSNMSLQYTKALFKQRHVRSRLQTLLGVAYPGLTEITNSSHQAHTCIADHSLRKVFVQPKNILCVL